MSTGPPPHRDFAAFSAISFLRSGVRDLARALPPAAFPDALRAAGKQLGHYLANDSTKAFLTELASDIGIPISELIQIVRGGDPSLQGTWVHPDVAVHLGQWLSPKFAVAVSKWVREWLAGGQYGGTQMPYHLERYIANRSKVPYTHFSVLNELTFNLIAPLEQQGYTLPGGLDIGKGDAAHAIVEAYMALDCGQSPALAGVAVMRYAATKGGGYGVGKDVVSDRDRKRGQ